MDATRELDPQGNDGALLLICEINNDDKRGNSMFDNNGTEKKRIPHSFEDSRSSKDILRVFKITKD